MPQYFWNICFGISVSVAILSSILIARKVFQVGIERFSSRMLILSCIVNTVLCGVLFVFQSSYELYNIFTAKTFNIFHFIIVIILSVLPIKVIWNFSTSKVKLISKHNLIPHIPDDLTATVSSFSKTLGIAKPVILSSSSISTPFVFGHRSNRSILAIPNSWQTHFDRNQQIQLLHELSHIRNHDIGFLAWANACLKDIKLFLIAIPVLIISSLVFGPDNIIASLLIYIICTFMLYVMLRYVIRKRESLADMTAAMLIESDKVISAITDNKIKIPMQNLTKQSIESRNSDKLKKWLTDKALFSDRPGFWKILHGFFDFFYTLHPSKTQRVKSITSKPKDSLPLFDSFWVGVSLGLMAVIIALGGYWLARILEGFQYEIASLKLPFKIFGIAGPIIMIFLAVLPALPVWSAFKQPALNRPFIVSILIRYSITLVIASLVCLLVYVARAPNLLFIICICWCICMAFLGFVINIVAVFLWMSIRHFQPNYNAKELRKSVLTFGLFVCAILTLMLTGFTLMNKGHIFNGANIILSTFGGCALTIVVAGQSRTSETEQFFIICIFNFNFKVESKYFNFLILLRDSIGGTVLLLMFALPIYFCIEMILGPYLQDISSRSCLIFMMLGCCLILVSLNYCSIFGLGGAKRHKIYSLYHSSLLLSKSFDTNYQVKIDKVIASYGKNINRINQCQNLTIGDLYELSILIDKPRHSKVLTQAIEWILRCQNPGGFGLWPGSSSRLYSTWQALTILQENDMLDRCNIASHTSWLKTLQQSDGSFKGPFSSRFPWQETFYVTESLKILNASLEPEKAELCYNFCHIALEKGIEKNDPEIIFHCLGSIIALGTLNENISKQITDWLPPIVDQLLLTNISLNYENVHFMVRIQHLLNNFSEVPSPQLSLLTERIQTALIAELADIKA
ncbi:MAG: M48 family metalloprotease [Phycisphaerae bacterium]|nr:M48 family metalloprotease [Phycisphaerae bacterium]